MWSLIMAAALVAQFSGPGGGVSPEECISVGGGTFSGPVCFKDNIELQLGTACGDSNLYYDGTDTTQVDLGATDGFQFVLSGAAPPSAGGNYVKMWGSEVGTANCGANTLLCLENNGNGYISFELGATGFGGFTWGDNVNNSEGALLYGMSSNATDPSQFRFSANTNTRFLDMGIGVMEHKQATTYSTTAGDLTDDPAGDLVQKPGTNVSTTYDDRNGFAVSRATTEETLTFASGGGDASKTTSGLIPAGAREVVIAAYVVTTGTTCTSADYGESGGTVDLWGDNIAVAATTTVDPTDYTSNVSFNTEIASEVVITGVPGNCVDMVVRVVAEYRLYTAPTG